MPLASCDHFLESLLVTLLIGLTLPLSAQSINEELKSTTEELETSKEELQSMNEEAHIASQWA